MFKEKFDEEDFISDFKEKIASAYEEKAISNIDMAISELDKAANIALSMNLKEDSIAIKAIKKIAKEEHKEKIETVRKLLEFLGFNPDALDEADIHNADDYNLIDDEEGGFEAIEDEDEYEADSDLDIMMDKAGFPASFLGIQQDVYMSPEGLEEAKFDQFLYNKIRNGELEPDMLRQVLKLIEDNNFDTIKELLNYDPSMEYADVVIDEDFEDDENYFEDEDD